MAIEGDGLLARWWIFAQERFAPVEHLLMVFFLVLGNASIGCRLLGAEMSIVSFAASYVVAMMFFFRLRCFDEIKDYAVDLRVNPGRPLARGLLTIAQVKTVIYSLVALEVAITLMVGWALLLVHVVAIIYSFIMYKEFFIGKHLSPHLTTYAVMHTFVSVLVGYSVIALNAGASFSEFSSVVFVFGLVNWAIFNLFEFARKTYSKEEERPTVDTYSSLFGPVGAGLLSLSQVLLALVVVYFVASSAGEALPLGLAAFVQVALAAVIVVVTCVYMFRPSIYTAKLFRGVSAAYLVLFFAIISWQGLA